MLALGAVVWQILVIEILDKFLHFETKFLVEQHGRIGDAHMERNILARACLNEVIQHERADSTLLPFRVQTNVRDVAIRRDEATPDHQLPDQHDNCVFWVNQRF